MGLLNQVTQDRGRQIIEGTHIVDLSLLVLTLAPQSHRSLGEEWKSMMGAWDHEKSLHKIYIGEGILTLRKRIMKAFFLTLCWGLGLAKRVSKLDCIKKNSLCAIWLTIDHWPPMVKRCSVQKNAVQTLPHSEGFQTDPILKPSHAHNCRPHPYAAASNVRPHHRTSWEGHVLHRILSVHFRSCQPKMPLLVRVQDAVGISLALFHTQGAKV